MPSPIMPTVYCFPGKIRLSDNFILDKENERYNP